VTTPAPDFTRRHTIDIDGLVFTCVVYYERGAYEPENALDQWPAPVMVTFDDPDKVLTDLAEMVMDMDSVREVVE